MKCELMLGDCLERMKEIPDQSVDMVMCDLPYGTTACAWDSVIPFAPLWEQYWRICKGAVVLTASQPFTSAVVASCMTQFKHAWVWNKSKAANFVQAKRHPLKIHEDVLVFGAQRYAPIMVKGEFRKKGGYSVKRETAVNAGAPAVFNDEYYPKSILDFSVAGNQDSKLHPTQKPVALMDYLIRTYTNPGDVVLDNCMGSGTTGVAAIEACRSFIGIERDEGYFAIAEKRIKDCETYKMLWG